MYLLLFFLLFAALLGLRVLHHDGPVHVPQLLDQSVVRRRHASGVWLGDVLRHATWTPKVLPVLYTDRLQYHAGVHAQSVHHHGTRTSHGHVPQRRHGHGAPRDGNDAAHVPTDAGL